MPVSSARWAARSRALSLERACARGEAARVAQPEARIMRLEDAVAFRDARLEALERQLGEGRPRRPYPLLDRLRLLWLIEYQEIPKRRAKEIYGLARSSVRRRLKTFQQGRLGTRRSAAEPVNKTPREIAGLIWDIPNPTSAKGSVHAPTSFCGPHILRSGAVRATPGHFPRGSGPWPRPRDWRRAPCRSAASG
jgi:hypothetical protein